MTVIRLVVQWRIVRELSFSLRVFNLRKKCYEQSGAYFGDPNLIDVPIEALLSPEYAKKRRQLIRSDRAWPELPPAGDPRDLSAERGPRRAALRADTSWKAPELDTSYVCVIDSQGNIFSATPSDGSFN